VQYTGNYRGIYPCPDAATLERMLHRTRAVFDGVERDQVWLRFVVSRGTTLTVNAQVVANEREHVRLVQLWLSVVDEDLEGRDQSHTLRTYTPVATRTSPVRIHAAPRPSFDPSANAKP